MNDTDTPNPFTSARRVAGIAVMLKASDIIEVWHSLTLEQAERVLDVHDSTIASQMLAAGLDAAVRIIEQEGKLISHWTFRNWTLSDGGPRLDS